MMKSLKQFNVYLKKHFHHEFQIGIGIHSGTAIVGKLGFSKKREFTALGDTVNTASRIEALNKQAQSEILVSEHCYQMIKDTFHFGKTFKAKVKGKEEDIYVFELLGTI